MTEYRNPLKRWFRNQPLSKVTQYTLADDVGIDQSYVSDLMNERCRILPSLAVAVRIEAATGGRVKPSDFYSFVVENREAYAAARAEKSDA